MKYYDSENNRLLYFSDFKVKAEFWDNHWLINKPNHYKFKFNPKLLINKITQRFLAPKDGPILEGGCGLGDKVYLLKRKNYNVVGIDTAKLTIEKIKKEYPEINIKFGDVRDIPFPNNYFIGYWSLGVIEHFFNGYNEIAKEMYRVLKQNGYLFLTFPYMSPFRKFKARSHLFKLFNNKYYKLEKNPETFYQYVLNLNDVIYNFKNLGFKLIYKSPEDGIKGFKDEIFFLKFFIKTFLQLLYNTNKPTFIRKIKRIIDIILARFSAHMMLLVLQKT